MVPEHKYLAERKARIMAERRLQDATDRAVYHTTKSAAAFLGQGVSPDYIRGLCYRRILPFQQVQEGGKMLIAEADLVDLLEYHPSAAQILGEHPRDNGSAATHRGHKRNLVEHS